MIKFYDNLSFQSLVVTLWLIAVAAYNKLIASL